jgi:TPR repeat protein
MKTRPHGHSYAILLGACAALFAGGCAQEGLFTNRVEVGGLSYNAQDCVEHALRNHPDTETVREARTAFSDACKNGEAAACSAVGVMYEVGVGVPMDTRRARELYGTACEAHNARACENLAGLMAADTTYFYEQVATNQP